MTLGIPMETLKRWSLMAEQLSSAGLASLLTPCGAAPPISFYKLRKYVITFYFILFF